MMPIDPRYAISEGLKKFELLIHFTQNDLKFPPSFCAIIFLLLSYNLVLWYDLLK